MWSKERDQPKLRGHKGRCVMIVLSTYQLLDLLPEIGCALWESFDLRLTRNIKRSLNLPREPMPAGAASS